MYSSIDSFINRKIVVLREKDSALKAARAMCDNQVGCVVVYNHDSELTGILTDRDIACNLISEELDPYLPIKKIMETDLITMPETGTINEAIDLMKANGIRRLPITGTEKKHQRKCIGIVTLDDLIAGQFINSLDLSEIVKSQIRRRKVFEPGNHRYQSSSSQTYYRFLKIFSETLGLDKKDCEDVVLYLLGIIVQRLHYTGGTHFISQLPKYIQESLFDLPAGPNRSISDKTILNGLKLRTHQPTEDCKHMAQVFWQTLKSIIGDGETDHVLHQLPIEIKRLFDPTWAHETMASFGPIPPPMEKL